MNANYILMNDIPMSCFNGLVQPIGTDTVTFNGIFDGRGFTISDWKFEDPALTYVGLFRSIRGATILNLKLKNFTVTGNTHTGALAGFTSRSLIREVHVENGTITGQNSAGGMIGWASMSAIDYSTSSASVSGTTKVGGVAGQFSGRGSGITFSGTVSGTGNVIGGITGDATELILHNVVNHGVVNGAANVGGIAGQTPLGLKNCFSTGAINGTTNVGGIVGTGARATNCFSTSTVSGNGGTDLNVGPLFGQLTDAITNSYYLDNACDADSATAGQQACNTLGTGSHASISHFQNKNNEPLLSWDFTGSSSDGTNNIWINRNSNYPRLWTASDTEPSPFSGSGTSINPYLISNISEFNLIGSNPRYMGSAYRLTQNLNFTSQVFVPIGQEGSSFYGSIDGDNHSIIGPTVANGGLGNDYYQGMINMSFRPGFINDVTISSANVAGTYIVGGLSAVSTINLSNVHFSGTIIGGWHSGGLIGLKDSLLTSIVNSSADVTITGVGYLGGLVGNLNGGEVRFCRSSGTVSGTGARVGGLIGALNGRLEDSYSTADVNNTSQMTGGIVGLIQTGSVERVYASGNVSSNTINAGGIAGIINAGATINDSFYAGSSITANGTTANIRYTIGVINGTYTNMYYNSGAVCDRSNTAGIQACGTTATGTAALADFYLSTQAPLTNWNFTDVWQENVGALPTLR